MFNPALTVIHLVRNLFPRWLPAGMTAILLASHILQFQYVPVRWIELSERDAKPVPLFLKICNPFLTCHFLFFIKACLIL